tara:strand:- start:98 stop:211 length:114 start_codon:yes stop_codon:yes gene_type:complete
MHHKEFDSVFLRNLLNDLFVHNEGDLNELKRLISGAS